jgi:hypothetical protein
MAQFGEEHNRYDLIPEADKSSGRKVWLTPNGAVPIEEPAKVETDLDRIRRERQPLDIESISTE